MSGGILGRRLAGSEGAYFFQESKNAVGRLTEKLPTKFSQLAKNGEPEVSPDVLPEILCHSLPLTPSSISSSYSFSSASKWVLPPNTTNSSGRSPNYDALINPLKDFVSLPRVTFGPKRWQLPDQQHSVSASTANELRHDRYSHVPSNQLQAAAAGLSQIGKAFAIATVLVFGGATSTFVLMVSKLELQTADDIRSKGRDFLHPKVEMVREQLDPLRAWAVKASRKWHIEGEGEAKEEKKKKPLIIKEISKMLGSKTPN